MTDLLTMFDYSNMMPNLGKEKYKLMCRGCKRRGTINYEEEAKQGC